MTMSSQDNPLGSAANMWASSGRNLNRRSTPDPYARFAAQNVNRTPAPGKGGTLAGRGQGSASQANVASHRRGK